MFTIKGKVAIITGPSGGIGKGVAMKFAEAGFDIFGVDYADCAELKKEIEAKFGTKLEYMQADLTKTNADLAEKIVESAVEAFGRVDVLINNAGIARRCDAIDYKEEDWNAAITINLTTCFLLSQAVARQYMKQGTAVKLSVWRLCWPSAAAFAFRPTRPANTESRGSQKRCAMNGQKKASMLTPLRRVMWTHR